MAKSFDEIPLIRINEQTYPYDYPQFFAKTAQELGPIFKREFPPHLREYYGRYVVFMVGPEANRFVMSTNRDAFSNDKGWTPTIGNLFPKGLLNTDDPEHARQRKIMNPAFSIAYMNKYLPIMQKIIAERTKDWAERGEVDLYEETRKIAFDVAAEALVGLQTGAEVDRLRHLFFALLSGDYNIDFYSAKTELTTMLLRLIAERRQTPTDDILGILVNARDEDGDGFSDEELLGQVNILLVAGHETTTTMSAWLLYLLAEHPEYLARVETELKEALRDANGNITLESLRAMKALGNAVDEAGRLHPPVGHAPRGIVREVEFGGYTIPVNTRVDLVISATHFLPDVFTNPFKFDPDRFAPPREEDKRTPYSLVTFGGGPRVCIGMSFAQIEMRAMAAHILQRYHLAPVTNQQIVSAFFGPTASLLNGLKIKVSKHTS